MKLYYNGLDLSTLGELGITQSRELEGGEQPQRARVRLMVRLDLFQRTYDENHVRVTALRKALSTPNAVLRWTNEAVGVDYVNQTATLLSDDLPEAWGSCHQVVNLVFTYYEQTAHGASDNLPLLFTKTGGTAFRFDVVNTWQHSASVERFSTLRKHRKETRGRIRVEGQFLADTRESVSSRRMALAARAKAMIEQLNCAEGRLVFGEGGSVFSETVRIEEFSADYDQLLNAIRYSFTASYTLFPNEANHATMEFTATEKDDFSGQLTLLLSGRIQAQTEAAARSRFTALMAAVVQQRGYAGGQQLSLETSPNTVNANADGSTFMELAFSVSWRKWKATNQRATFQGAGSQRPVQLGNVIKWRDHYAAQRFNDQRSQRRHATGSVDASGVWSPGIDGALTVSQRRAHLLAMQRAMKAAVNCADGTLAYGDWSQVVRVEDFQAEINQAETGIEWSLSANYSLFPNEGGYATAEYTLSTRQVPEEGDEFLMFSGRIAAPTQAMALSKLAVVRTALLSSHGWSLTQRIRDESAAASVQANGDRTNGDADAADGTTFIELTFAEEYRRRIQGTLIGSTLQVTSREDVASQLLLTTYSGTVTASGPTADAAHAAALARARELGADREGSIDSTACLRGDTIAFEKRQPNQDCAMEFLRLTFTYEYQSKLAAGRAWIEMTTGTQRDTFGADVETCSGFVAARDEAAARAIYAAQVKAPFAKRLIQNEQVQAAACKNQTANGFNTQHLRLEFSFQAWLPKAAGTISLKYAVEVSRDFLTLEMRTCVQGSCFASTRTAAEGSLDALFSAMGWRNPVRRTRSEDRQAAGCRAEFSKWQTALLKLDFNEEFAGRVTGAAGVCEMKLTERVVYSGTRWSVQPIPFDSTGAGGISIPQPTGVEPGSRTVSGSVTAGTLATAQAWAARQRALLTGDRSGSRYPQPEQWETDFEFVPRIDGIVSGPTANVRLYRVSFQFGEILPEYGAGFSGA